MLHHTIEEWLLLYDQGVQYLEFIGICTVISALKVCVRKLANLHIAQVLKLVIFFVSKIKNTHNC